LDKTVRDELDKILARFPKEKDQLIPILETVQESFGYLPKECMEEVSRYLRVSEANIYGVASFYALFRFTPRGKIMIHVCRGTACHVKGGSRILDEVEKRVGIKAGETTQDMEYSLETISCFGSCALAPVMVVNKEFHGRVTPEGVATILGDGKK
jgi:NADH:ubiquinone oxidoreductase subunit E